MRQFQKRRSARLTVETYLVLALTALPFALAGSALMAYVYGVIHAFKASVVLGVVFLFPPLGIVEGIAKLFRYDVAMALKAVAAANGLML